MNKRILAGFAVAALAILPFGSVHADPSPEGCAVVAGEGADSGTITEVGTTNGIVAGGTWHVTIVRPGVEDPIEYGDTHGVPQNIQNVFQVGDQVSCTADEGAVIAGRI